MTRLRAAAAAAVGLLVISCTGCDLRDAPRSSKTEPAASQPGPPRPPAS